jgi:hypothetical protein
VVVPDPGAELRVVVDGPIVEVFTAHAAAAVVLPTTEASTQLEVGPAATVDVWNLARPGGWAPRQAPDLRPIR